MRVGDIVCDSQFYVDRHGELKSKYMLILAVAPGDDIVARLLTSQSHARTETPPCSHGLPYGGYFLGVPGHPLSLKTWVDLRHLDDLDRADFAKGITKGSIPFTMTLPGALLRDVIACVAGADDTTKQQERCLRDGICDAAGSQFDIPPPLA